MKKLSKPILELSNICRTDKSGTVERLNLSISSGDCFAVVYDSDKNISLLTEILSGRVPLKKGKIFFKGDDVTGSKNVFGIVTSSPSMPKLKTVAAYAATPVVKRGLSRSMADVLIRKEMKPFGLTELADEKCLSLSQSNAVKAAIFTAYMCSHELMVIHDPFSKLPDEQRKEALEWFNDMRTQTQISLLLFTKDIDLAVETADYVMAVDKNTASNGIIAVDKKKKERAKEQIEPLINS